MATLGIQNIDLDGLDPVLVAAAAGGDKVIPGQGSYIEIRTTGTASNVTLVTPEVFDADLALPDRVIAMPATGVRKVAVSNRYRSPTDGLASVTYSSVVGLTIGSFRGPTSDA